MTDPVVMACPRCGAALEPEPGAPRVLCRYCGAVMDVAAPQAPPPLYERVPRHVPSSPPKRSRFATSFLAAAVVITSVTAGLAYYRQAHSSAAIRGLSPLGPGDVAIVASDLKSVDPTALIHQAGAEVRHRDSNCELTYAYVGEVRQGALDATGSTSLLEWSCHHVDHTKPPGQDVTDDSWSVRVLHGALTLEKSTISHHNDPPWAEPTCPFSDAWSAAVSSGLPSNAIVTVYYGTVAVRSHQQTIGWNLVVSGHPEFERRIDGATCRVLE